MPHSRGSRLPFLRLHTPQAVQTLVHIVRPPRERGIRWSNVRCSAERCVAQYWQVNRSRRNTLNRVNAGRRACGTYSFSAITLGSFIAKDGECTTRSYSESTFTRSMNTAFTVSCQDQSESGK